MNHLSRKTRVFLFSLILALSLAGRAPGQTDALSPLPGVTADHIRIGSWGPQSGVASSWGATVRGTETYFKWINANGGIHGRKLELVWFDELYDTDKTLAGVRKMAEEDPAGLFAVTGGIGARSGKAVMEYLDEQGIPWIGPGSNWSGFADPPKKNIFAVLPPGRDEAAALVKYAVEVMGKKKIGILYIEDEYGQEGARGAREQLSEYGFELAGDVPIKPGYRALKTRVLRMKEAAPEVVLLWAAPVQAATFLIDSKEYGFQPVWMAGSPLADAELMEKVTNGLWEGTIFAACGEAPGSENPLLKKYHQAFRDYGRLGERWGVVYYAGFGLAEPLVEAIGRAGPGLTRASLVEQLENLHNFKGVLGPITYGPARRQGQTAFYLCQAVDRGGVRPLTGWFRFKDLPPPPEFLRHRPEKKMEEGTDNSASTGAEPVPDP